jgi:ribosomal protein S18 acetylase RimI-like enzyme
MTESEHRELGANASRASCRRATAEDVTAICELARELKRSHHDAWPNLFAADSDAASDEPHWRHSVLAAGNAAFVAEADSRVVGFITVSVADETHSLMQAMRYARVNSVCVAPDARSAGIGRRLMSTAEQWSAAQGATDVRLMVYEFNADAIRLYELLGYSTRSRSMGRRIGKDRVVHSVNNDQADRCVDFILSADGTYGFKEFRRDPEDQGAWTLTAHDRSGVHLRYEDALAAALEKVVWLAGARSFDKGAKW